MSSSTKRLRDDHQVGVDRISQLPDCLIREILSGLPTIDAVKTGFLSHQWRHQWKTITALDFKFDLKLGETDINIQRVAQLVTSTLLLHENRSSISRFSVSCGHFIHAEVDKWIQMLTSDAQVKELTLHLGYSSPTGKYYELKKILYTAAFLTKLDILGCIVYPHHCSIRWDSLKILTLGMSTSFSPKPGRAYRKIDDAIMKKILEGSPVLEVLKFDGVGCYGTLHLSHENLKELEIQWFSGGWFPGGGKIEITAPSLQSLILESELHLGGLRVVKAASSFRCRLNLPAGEGVVLDLRHVEHLSFGPWFLKALSGNWVVEPAPPKTLLGHCKFLTLESSIDNWDWNLAGMDKALRSSPLLEMLFINLTTSVSLSDDEEDGSDKSNDDRCERYLSDENDYWKRNMKPVMLHLRTISITLEGVLREPVNLLRLVQLFLNNAATLEKLIVSARGGGCNQELFEMCDKFIAFPNKLSPRAVVQFMHRSS